MLVSKRHQVWGVTCHDDLVVESDTPEAESVGGQGARGDPAGRPRHQQLRGVQHLVEPAQGLAARHQVDLHTASNTNIRITSSGTRRLIVGVDVVTAAVGEPLLDHVGQLLHQPGEAVHPHLAQIVCR